MLWEDEKVRKEGEGETYSSLPGKKTKKKLKLTQRGKGETRGDRVPDWPAFPGKRYPNGRPGKSTGGETMSRFARNSGTLLKIR